MDIRNVLKFKSIQNYLRFAINEIWHETRGFSYNNHNSLVVFNKFQNRLSLTIQRRTIRIMKLYIWCSINPAVLFRSFLTGLKFYIAVIRKFNIKCSGHSLILFVIVVTSIFQMHFINFLLFYSLFYLFPL